MGVGAVTVPPPEDEPDEDELLEELLDDELPDDELLEDELLDELLAERGDAFVADSPAPSASPPQALRRRTATVLNNNDAADGVLLSRMECMDVLSEMGSEWESSNPCRRLRPCMRSVGGPLFDTTVSI